MKYPYHVKANGCYYAPGEEVEETNGEVDSKMEQELTNRHDVKQKGRREKERMK